jgi:hypothetical protein
VAQRSSWESEGSSRPKELHGDNVLNASTLHFLAEISTNRQISENTYQAVTNASPGWQNGKLPASGGPRILAKGMSHQNSACNDYVLENKENMMIMKYDKIVNKKSFCIIMKI